MAEKNTNENKNSKKKHKWIGVVLVALLLLFIGLAGYYLERDLEPVPDNQIEDSEVLDESSDTSDADTAMNNEESETASSDTTETEIESDQVVEEDEEKQITADSETEATEDEADNKVATDTQSSTDDETTATDVEAEENKEDDDSAMEVTEDQEVLSKEENNGETQETETSIIEDETTSSETTDAEKESEQAADDQSAKSSDSSDFEQESDISQESGDSVVNDSQVDNQLDREDQVEKESQNDFNQELEDPTLLDRILSILGLSDSSFSQDLNILFVGLDDEESVALGSIEADSIMIAKIRPEINKIQLENINEDTIYKGQLLREYHNGDIQVAAEEITGNEIDYYVNINYQGFEKVIDELGGVKITLDQEVKVPGLGLNLKEGDNLLSGKEALNFVRWQSSDSMDRFERQKMLINSVMIKLKSNNILFNVKDLYNTIVESYNSIETDINPVLAAEIFKYLRENDELELEFIE